MKLLEITLMHETKLPKHKELQLLLLVRRLDSRNLFQIHFNLLHLLPLEATRGESYSKCSTDDSSVIIGARWLTRKVKDITRFSNLSEPLSSNMRLLPFFLLLGHFSSVVTSKQTNNVKGEVFRCSTANRRL